MFIINVAYDSSLYEILLGGTWVLPSLYEYLNNRILKLRLNKDESLQNTKIMFLLKFLLFLLPKFCFVLRFKFKIWYFLYVESIILLYDILKTKIYCVYIDIYYINEIYNYNK